MKMHKLLALLLALVMVFALCACDKDEVADDDDDEDVVTTTSSTTAAPNTSDDPDPEPDPEPDPSPDPDPTPDDPEVTTNSVVGTWTSPISMDISEEAGTDASLDYDLIWVFAEDGTVTMTFDEDSVEEAYEDLIPIVIESYRAEFDEEEFGMTWEEFYDYMMEYMDEAYDIEDFVPVAEKTTCEWSLDGDTLTIDDVEYDVEFSGKKMTISGGDLADELGVDELVLTPSSSTTITPPVIDTPASGDATVAGKWSYTYSMDVGELLGTDDLGAPLDLVMLWNFKNDGTATISYDGDAYKASLEAAMPVLIEAFAAEFDEDLYGMTLEEYSDLLMETMMAEDFGGEEEDIGEWSVEGDTLIIDDIAYNYAFDGGDLIITGGDLEDQLDLEEIRLTRVN